MKKYRRFFQISFFLVFTIFIFLLIYAILFPIQLPSSNITMYDANNNIIYKSTASSDLTLEECPDFIEESIICVEDKRFYRHIGFDLLRILKSFYNNIKNASIVEGGSTITQQYAKNIFLSNRQTLNRKINELIYALQIEMHYSKEEILEGYMNSIYYGHGIYGFKNAADFYFGKAVDDLNISEIALLIGIPNGPSYYSPILNMDNALLKRNQILDVLYRNNKITLTEYEQSLQEQIHLDNKDYEKENEKNYYVDAVINEVFALGYSGNLKIYTYYDEKAQNALSSSISLYTKDKSLQSSGIVMEPYSGNIIALQGGNDYTKTSYNRAIYSQRQVASTIKPLLYYCALTQGFTPSSTFTSKATSFPLEDGTYYTPENYNKYYPNKEISMIQALRTSDNIYAVKTHLFLGKETLQEALKAFHINTHANASLALGTVNLSIYDISRIYNTFASEGYYVEPSFISSITQNGEIVYERTIEPKQLLNRDITLVLNQLLTSTYDMTNIDVVYPTLYGKEANVKTAVKSGTSNWDTWAIGFNPYYTVGIWNGYDENMEMDKSEYEISKSIWQNCFNTLMEDKKEVWYEPSRNIVLKKVDPISGKEDSTGSVYWYLR